MKLTNSQEEALSKFRNFLNTKERVFSLIGYAGTGKTWLTNRLLYEVEKSFCSKSSIAICAFTNQALSQIEEKTEHQYDSFTIHQILGLKPSMDLDDFDVDNILFSVGKDSPIRDYKFIAVDEGSMVGNNLYSLLLTKLVTGAKIMFVGDGEQLKPVKSSNSSVLSNKVGAELKEIVRTSSNSILELSDFIRNYKGRDIRAENFNRFKSEDITIIDEEEFRNSTLLKDTDKIVVYMNDKVDLWNRRAKSIKNPITDEWEDYCRSKGLKPYTVTEGDSIVFYKDLTTLYDSKHKGNVQTPIGFIRSSTGEKLKNGQSFTCRGYTEDLDNIILEDNKTNDIMIIPNKVLNEKNTNYFKTEYIKYLNRARKAAFDKKKFWLEFFDFDNQYITSSNITINNPDTRRPEIRGKTFDLGYAMTAHKLQGATCDVVAVDLKNLFLSKQEVKNLLYVAVTRAAKKLIILT